MTYILTDRHNNYTLLTGLKEQFKKIPGLLKTIRFIRKKIQYRKLISELPKNTRYNPESKIKFDKTPYIIHRENGNGGLGLFAYFLAILGGISFADKNNLTPCQRRFLFDRKRRRILTQFRRSICADFYPVF